MEKQPRNEQPETTGWEASTRDGPAPQAGPDTETADDRGEVESTAVPRIYVASLSDYNAGILHGRWINADQTVEAMQAQINEMLGPSPTTKRYGDIAEEWAIHDHEGWGRARIGEWEPLQRLARLAQGIVEHGEAFAAWWDNETRADEDWADIETQFQQQYLGEYDSVVEYAEQLLEEIGFDIDQIEGVPESLQPYLSFDIDGWARDLVIGGDIYTVESERGVHVFSAD